MELFPLKPYCGKSVCVALSGGADSVCLLHYFYSYAAEYAIKLSAVTCEHGIRGKKSIEDLAFVENLCKKWNVPLRVFRADVPQMAKNAKIGLEEAGRNFRYACFDAMRQGADGVDFVATAHHKDDLIETVLFRLIRGTSLGGLNVFPERNGIIRPLSNVSRAQIMQYVRENSLSYVTDESNSDETYTRNYLRRTVLPALEQAVHGAGDHLADFALRAVQDDDFLQQMAKTSIRFFAGEYCIPADLPSPLFTRACVDILKRHGITKDYTETNLKEIAALKALQSGKRASLPQGLCAVREYENIVFYRPDSPMQTPFDGEIPFDKGTFSLNGKTLIVAEALHGARERGNFVDSRVIPSDTRESLKVDLDAFPPSSVIRTRREGDLFTPFGGNAKTLKKFLTDKKISARRGRLLPLIANGNEILAICGVEISDKVKITEKTTRQGYLTVAPFSENE